MLEFVRRVRGAQEPPTPESVQLARREAERQLEWAETYLAAVEGIDLDDPLAALEVRRLRAAVRDLCRSLSRPHLL